MRHPRRITVSTHGVIELVAGLALILASVALDMGAAGTVLTFVAGVIVAGVGLMAPEGLSLAVHESLDRLLAVALAAAAVGAALWGSETAAIALLAVAALQLLLHDATRWTRVPLTR